MNRADAIAALRTNVRALNYLMRTDAGLHLQQKAFCRGLAARKSGSHTADLADAGAIEDAVHGKGTHPMFMAAGMLCVPLMEAQQPVQAAIKVREKHITQLAQQLPAAGFFQDTPGLTVRGLGLLVGEVGDLSDFANPAKLWKFCGLHVVEGAAVRRAKGECAGFSIRRRSMVLYRIAQPACERSKTMPYALVYRERKEHELKQAALRGQAVLPAAKIKRGQDAMSEGHVRARALRYAAKRILRDAWREWTRS